MSVSFVNTPPTKFVYTLKDAGLALPPKSPALIQ